MQECREKRMNILKCKGCGAGVQRQKEEYLEVQGAWYCIKIKRSISWCRKCGMGVQRKKEEYLEVQGCGVGVQRKSEEFVEVQARVPSALVCGECYEV